VRSFADVFKQKYTKLDILINNAGVFVPPAAKTNEGYELQFGINFLGHFALTGLLYPLLKAMPESRVGTLISLAYSYLDEDTTIHQRPFRTLQNKMKGGIHA
jgi:NAD(P)-dependent dehydrogenase (short-subunit alcohol dehydrogenase family)